MSIYSWKLVADPSNCGGKEDLQMRTETQMGTDVTTVRYNRATEIVQAILKDSCN